MNRFDILIRECDSAIQLGRSQEVSSHLARLKGARIPREYRLPLAKICRRAGLLSTGLRLLFKLVNSDTGEAPTPSESAEFAILLLRSGAVHESLERLSQIDTKQVPDALLFQAYGCFALWEFKEAAHYLERFIGSPLSPASLLLGRTNLAFAHMECRQHDKALELIEENVRMAHEQKNLNLECYNHAVCAQVHIQENQFAKAASAIDQAVRESAKAQTHDQFFVTKLSLVLQALRENSLQPLEVLKQMARQRRDWFALRDADFYMLKVEWKLERFLHLYFGSPFDRFREHLRKEFNIAQDRKMYVLGAKQTARLDLQSGKLDDKVVMDVGGKCHQVIEVLLRDFYQPLTVAGIHSALFPNERFDISSSPDRIRQLIRRTRQWIKESGIAASITQDSGFYALLIREELSVRIPLERRSVDLQTLQLQKMRDQFVGGQIFSRHDLCEKLRLSNSAAHRLLRAAIEVGQIERLGPLKRPTGYRMTTRSELQAA